MLQAAVRVAGRLVSSIAPTTAGRLGLRLFCRPPARRASARIAALLADGERSTVEVRGNPIALWSWGRGPRVLLIHGWGGVGGQLATFVPALLERGYAATVIDAPGHGASAGRESSMIHFTDALHAAQRTHGPAHALVAHSLGASAATLAMTQGLDVDAAVFIGAAPHPAEWVEMFARHIGLTTAAIDSLRREAEKELGFTWDAIDTLTLARGRRTPLLLIHDANDDEVPIADGREVADAWAGARFLETRGLGHRKILSDPEVILGAAGFISAIGSRLSAVAEVPADSRR